MNRTLILLGVLTLILSTILLLMPDSRSHPNVSNKAFSFLLAKLLKHNVPEISVQEFRNLGNDIYLLDTRSKEEFEISHIPGAIWVGHTVFDLESVKNIPRDGKIIAYCSIGYRSEAITHKMVETGYTNISNLYGGIFEWVNQGGDLHNTYGEPTDILHAYNKVWGIWVKTKRKVYDTKP